MVSEKHFTKKLKIILHSKVFYLLLCIIISIYEIGHLINPPILDEKKQNISFEGKIIDYDWQENTNRIKLRLKIAAKEVEAFYNYKDDEEPILKKEIQYKIIIKGKGVLNVPSENNIPNTFSYRKYLLSQNITHTLEIKEFHKLKNASLKDQIHTKVRNILEKNKNKTYLKMLLLGIKEDTKENLQEIYQKNGITHLFTISGMHLAIIYKIFSSVSQKIFKKEKLQSLFNMSFLTIYYSFLRKNVSSTRAFLFYIISILSKQIKLDLTSKQIFILTLSLILLKNPYSVYNIGFQYTFLLSFTYIFFPLKEKRRWFYYIKGSIRAFLMSLPITINSLYTINPWSILINCLMIPLVTKLLLPSLILSIFLPVIKPLVTLQIKIIEQVNIICSNLPLANINIPKISLLFIIVIYLFLILYLKWHQKKWLSLLGAILIINICLPKIDRNIYFYFLDVKEGDSSLIITPYQKEIILIDTGPPNTYYLKNMQTFLKSLGISQIDYLLLSHGDADHAGEAINIVNNIKVNKVIFNCGEYNDLEKKLIKVIAKKKIKHYSCLKELTIDNKLQFLNTQKYNNENDNSSIIYANFNNFKFLWMGDASNITEKEILKKYNLTNIDVLKVGHRGSKTSSSKEFINTINPKYSIISVGKNNKYGHPNNEVLKHLENSKIYRTDINGTIIFKIKKDKLDIKTYLS